MYQVSKVLSNLACMTLHWCCCVQDAGLEGLLNDDMFCYSRNSWIAHHQEENSGLGARLFLLQKEAGMGYTGNHHEGTSLLLLLDKRRTGERRAVNAAAGRVISTFSTEIQHQLSFLQLSSLYTKGGRPSQQPHQPDPLAEPLITVRWLIALLPNC